MSEQMHDGKILLPGIYESAMRHIEELYPMDSTQLAMIAITVGSCIIQAKNSWTLTDFNRLEEDLNQATNKSYGE